MVRGYVKVITKWPTWAYGYMGLSSSLNTATTKSEHEEMLQFMYTLCQVVLLYVSHPYINLIISMPLRLVMRFEYRIALVPRKPSNGHCDYKHQGCRRLSRHDRDRLRESEL